MVGGIDASVDSLETLNPLICESMNGRINGSNDQRIIQSLDHE
jgi:hypothetical protein